MEGTSNNCIGTAQEDSKRFKKESKNKKLQKLFYVSSNEGIICRFLDMWDWHNVEEIDLMFIDSDGNRKILRKEDSSFSEIRILFSDWEKILIGYKQAQESEVKYCSWGYKKHSATTEKLYVYFRTHACTYLVYVDAQHPEHFFLISDYGKSAENLYYFLKSNIGELK